MDLHGYHLQQPHPSVHHPGNQAENLLTLERSATCEYRRGRWLPLAMFEKALCTVKVLFKVLNSEQQCTTVCANVYHEAVPKFD